MDAHEKKKILLIDDDVSLLLTLSDFLRFEEYSVVTANCGENGLKVLARMNPDLIILDMSMPGMGGMGFLKEISSTEGKPKYPVLVLTARANMAEFFANVDVAGFIAKPCDPNDLLMEVARIIFLTTGSMDKAHSPERKERMKILVGEDDGVAREKITAAFAADGYLVDTVAKGPEMLEKAIVQRPHAIVIKRIFAGMNGDTVADMLKEMPNTKSIPIVLYDDSGTSSSAARKYTEGKSNIRKFIRNSETEALLKAVKEVLGE